MIGFDYRGNEEYQALSGLWEETWCARARLAGQAERYRIWLRQQGCSRDQAAAMTVHVLLTGDLDAPASPNSSPAPVIH